MIIKVGDKIYDANDLLVAVYLTDEDKLNITNMSPEAKVYCAFPEGMSPKKAAQMLAKFRTDIEETTNE